MIVINCGMAKSATTLVAMYERDLIDAVTANNAIQYAKKHNKIWISEFNSASVADILKVHAEYGSFVVKTHSILNQEIEELVESGIAKLTFCYRDPRDTVLSAIDHGKKSREGLDGTGAFKDFYSVKDALGFVEWSINLYETYSLYEQALLIEYNDLMGNKHSHLERIADHLSLSVNSQQVHEIYTKHESLKENKKAWNFNKGTTERWKTEMPLDDLRLLESRYGKQIRRMGYELSASYPIK